MKLPFWMRASIRLPGKVAEDAEALCPECGLPCVHVQPRVNDPEDKVRPTYAFRCENYHVWAFIAGQQVLQEVNGKLQWESHE